MSLYSEVLEPVDEPMPGVEVFQLDAGMSEGEFEDFTDTLVIPEHWDLDGQRTPMRPAVRLGGTIAMSRTVDTPREPWAPDHHWHSDRTYWGDNQFASVLYAQSIDGDVAGTGLINTTLLLEAIEDDEPGIFEELSSTQTVFSVRRYYEEILPEKGSPEAIQRTLDRFDASSLSEVADKEERRYPEKAFPTLPMHPIWGVPVIMLDEVRSVRITNLPQSRGDEIIDLVVERYLRLDHDELAERPYYERHEWEEGQVLIFPQVGTLHRADASPDSEIERDTLRRFIA